MSPQPSPINGTDPAAHAPAARIAVEELTGLAVQERGLVALLSRQASESPRGGPRERVERHLRQAREHQRIFNERAQQLSGHRGPAELTAGVVRSGLAALGTVGATVGQVATAPFALLRQGGRQERLLENAGVEGAALANKLVILTAVNRALELSGEEDARAELARVRDEALQTWDELLEETPELMGSLVGAKAA